MVTRLFTVETLRGREREGRKKARVGRRERKRVRDCVFIIETERERESLHCENRDRLFSS